jgi:hypothetical protein
MLDLPRSSKRLTEASRRRTGDSTEASMLDPMLSKEF